MIKNILFLLTAFSFVFLFSACNATKKINGSQLVGTWELVQMPGAEKTIEELFAEKKPTAMFDANLNSIRGNGGCNNYNGAIKIEGNKIDLTAPIVSTKMACLNGSNGEYTYFNILTTVNNYNIVGDELEFFSGKVSVLKFSKKQ